MTRKLCVLLAAALAVTGAFFVPVASAQGNRTCAIMFDEEPVVEPAPTATTVPVETVETVETDDETDELVVANSRVLAESANAIAANSCADAETYPGPFTNMPVIPSGPYAAPPGLAASVPAAAPAATESPTAGLAHSGSEVFVLAYLGTGLLAFGAVALGIRRGAHFS